MQCHHNNTLCTITGRFAIDLDSLEVMVAFWDGAEDATALLKTQLCKDAAEAKCFYNGCAAVYAKALLKEAMRAKVLAPRQHQEDEVHTQALTSIAGKRSCQVATLLAAWMAKNNAWMAEYAAWMASQDCTKAEAVECAAVVAEFALIEERGC
jgi:hypothetical protein